MSAPGGLGYEDNAGSGVSGGGGDEDKHARKVTAGAGAMKSAINRLFNRNNKEFDPHTIDLSELARGRPRLEPGARGDVVLVFEEQPSTIIAYSLRSKVRMRNEARNEARSEATC